MENHLLIGAAVIASLGAAIDVGRRRIPNWLTYSGALAGLGLRALFFGLPGLEAGLAGLAISGGVLCAFFLLGGMGGGDVKLMAAIGAMVGPGHGLTILLSASIAGGILALLYVAFTSRLRQTFYNLVILTWHRVVSALQPCPPLSMRSSNPARVPFGVAIAIGTLYCAGKVFLWG